MNYINEGSIKMNNICVLCYNNNSCDMCNKDVQFCADYKLDKDAVILSLASAIIKAHVTLSGFPCNCTECELAHKLLKGGL